MLPAFAILFCAVDNQTECAEERRGPALSLEREPGPDDDGRCAEFK